MERKDIQKHNNIQLGQDSICFGFITFAFFYLLNHFTSLKLSLDASYIAILACLFHFFIMYETTVISLIQKFAFCLVIVLFILLSRGFVPLFVIQVFVITGLFVLLGAGWHELTRDIDDDE